MNTTNTNTLRTYLQVQAIEPTDNMQYLAKKSGKYTTMFLVTLIIGVLVSLTITPPHWCASCFYRIHIWLYVGKNYTSSTVPSERRTQL